MNFVLKMMNSPQGAMQNEEPFGCGGVYRAREGMEIRAGGSD